MFGKNEIKGIRAPEDYLVKAIWYTIQGEGPYAGFPAIFVRFSDCNLRCFFCDTDFTGGEQLNLEQLSFRITNLIHQHRCNLVVLTGGEPMLQDLGSLIGAIPRGLFQIETAGTIWTQGLDAHVDGRRLKIVCSPKTPGINPKIVEHCQDWKYILRQGETSLVDGLPARSTQTEGKFGNIYRAHKGTIYVQPCDEDDIEANAANIKLATETALTFNYRLSLQIHKLVGVD
jgi:7-carboxy-7-deazaguanine synthase